MNRTLKQVSAAALMLASVLLIGGSCSAADTTPPTTEAQLSGSSGSNGWNVSSVSVTLQASDSDSGVNYTTYNLSGAGWQNYTGDITVTGDGVHLLQYCSVDLANNTEATKNVTIKIDATDPAISLEQADGSVFGSSSVRITWTGSDTTSGIDYFEVYSDGALFDVIDNATRIDHITNLVDGWHNVTVRAYDMAGNYAEDKVNFRVWANQGASQETNILGAVLLIIAVVALILAIRWLINRKSSEKK